MTSELPSRNRITPQTAREVAAALTAYLAAEKLIVEYSQDDGTERLERAVELWIGSARAVNRARARAEHEVLTATEFGPADLATLKQATLERET